jgi:hypothetical protein
MKIADLKEDRFPRGAVIGKRVGGPTMFARIGVMKAPNRRGERAG